MSQAGSLQEYREKQTKDARDKAHSLLSELWDKDKGEETTGDGAKSDKTRLRLVLVDLVRCLDNERQY